MTTLKLREHRYRGSSVVWVSRGGRNYQLSGLSGSYEMALKYSASPLGWRDFIGTQCVGLAQPDQPERGGDEAPRLPFLPDATAAAQVYCFGYTHLAVNGVAVDRAKIDFYYKGPGRLLVCDGVPLRAAAGLVAGGIEVEYCAVYCVGREGDPVYLGFGLADDFSDVGLRKRYTNLAGLSKLQPTAVSSEIVLGEIPARSRVRARIERAGGLAWAREGMLGSETMAYSRRTLERLLFARPGVFEPGMMVYLLLGSCISSYRDGVVLESGDHIVIEDEATGLSLSNTFSVQ